MNTSKKPECNHDANFVITGSNGYGDIVITTSSADGGD